MIEALIISEHPTKTSVVWNINSAANSQSSKYEFTLAGCKECSTNIFCCKLTFELNF
jgi:hypothetical protein